MIKFKWLAVPLMAMYCMTANASNLPDFPFVLVTGEAKMKVSPDMATITFQLKSSNEDAEKALFSVGKSGRDIVTLLTKLKVKKSDIKSYALRKQVLRNRGKMYGQGEITGYDVTQDFEVTLRDIEQYSFVMDSLIVMKQVNNVNIQFDVSNRQALTQSLVKNAGSDAKQKAVGLALALGSKLGNVFAATQDQGFNAFFARFGLDNPNSGNLQMMKFSERAGNYNMFVPETIELNKTIHVVYKLK